MVKFLFYACILIGILGFLSGFILLFNGNGSAIGMLGLIGGSITYIIGSIGLGKNNG